MASVTFTKFGKNEPNLTRYYKFVKMYGWKYVTLSRKNYSTD